MRESRKGSGGKRDYNFLRTGLYKFRRDRHCHVKKGGMAGLPGKKDGIAGSENPIVDPRLCSSNFALPWKSHFDRQFFINL